MATVEVCFTNYSVYVIINIKLIRYALYANYKNAFIALFEVQWAALAFGLLPK